MSHSAPKKGAAVRAAQAMALLVVFGVMYLISRAVPPSESAAGLVAAMGFLLIAGMLASSLLETVGLPHLTGYLLAGALAGPDVLRLVDHHAVERLTPVNTLALSLIALAGGVELRVELLKQVFRGLVYSMVIQCVAGILVVGGAFLLIARHLPFTAGFSTTAIVGVSLLWGVLAVCRSPSALLGVFSELRPDGPVSRFSLAFVMSSDVIVAILLTIAIACARSLIEPSTGLSFKDFSALGHEIIGSVSLGTTLGLVLTMYLWLIGADGLLLVLIAIGFGLTEALHYLRFDPLLAFMVAGFVVANFSQQGPKLLSAVERAGNVVYVVFFATAGAHLDIPLLRRLWMVAVFLGGVRLLTIWVAHLASSRFADETPIIKSWGWQALVSQAGLTIGMTVVIERSFPAFGAGFRSIAIATIALNEIIGPVLLKLALDKTAETGKGNQEKAFHEAEGPESPAPIPAEPA